MAEFSLAQVADALLNGRVIRLSAPCHGAVWSASQIELQQIREYLAAVSLNQRQLSIFPH